MKASRTLAPLAGAAALLSILAFSRCRQTTEIIPFVAEICEDTLDNDQDGAVDCLDSDCNSQCTVTLAINAPPASIQRDTLALSGSHRNATGVSVTVRPVGTADATALTENNQWHTVLRALSDRGKDYTVTVIGTDAQGRNDTATAVFHRDN